MVTRLKLDASSLIKQHAKKYGRQILARALEACNERFPNLPIFIQAQTYLQSFYASSGFKPISDDYLEDGISHIDMILEN